MNSGTLAGPETLRSPRDLGPWHSELLTRLLLGNGLGLIAIAIGWWQVSGATGERTQVGWLVAVAAGVGIGGTSNAMWLLRGMQSVSVARDVVLPRLAVACLRETRQSDASPHHAAIVFLPTTQRFHLANCALVEGRVTKKPRPLDRAAIAQAPCSVCRPDRQASSL